MTLKLNLLFIINEGNILPLLLMTLAGTGVGIFLLYFFKKKRGTKGYEKFRKFFGLFYILISGVLVWFLFQFDQQIAHQYHGFQVFTRVHENFYLLSLAIITFGIYKFLTYEPKLITILLYSINKFRDKHPTAFYTIVAILLFLFYVKLGTLFFPDHHVTYRWE